MIVAGVVGMTDGRYETPRAMSMAVKAAAKASSQDTGQALLDYYHDRFLARVFCEKDSQFVLKGGRGMLARLVDVRRTWDTDLFYSGACRGLTWDPERLSWK